MKTHTNIVFK